MSEYKYGDKVLFRVYGKSSLTLGYYRAAVQGNRHEVYSTVGSCDLLEVPDECVFPYVFPIASEPNPHLVMEYTPSPRITPSPRTARGVFEAGGVSESNPLGLFQGNSPPGTKDDGGKLRWSLVPWSAMASVVDVLTYGATKYAPDNWKKVDNWRERYTDAAMRHMVDYMNGTKLDDGPKGSGRSHLAHAMCCLLFLEWFEQQEETSGDGSGGKEGV